MTLQVFINRIIYSQLFMNEVAGNTQDTERNMIFRRRSL
jgi:hypothetical protein